jgi:CheY-like chemotaxis protein
MRGTILIVEDTETCASVLEMALSGIKNIRVLTACDGDQAWRFLTEQSNILALVTDVHMPGMDGFQLIKRVRSETPHSAMPIIVITGCTDTRTPDRVRALGANAYFAKPYSPARVREKLEQLLNEHQV